VGKRDGAADLPPGQHAITTFPRFGATPYARRFPPEPDVLRLTVRRKDYLAVELGPERWSALPRRRQVSDFHCVTTWTSRGHAWEGVGFADFCEELGLCGLDQTRLVVLRGSDGYHAALPIADLIRPGVLLADRLDGAPLPLAHGAPVRLVAPAHYGYKSVKHLARIDFDVDPAGYRSPGPSFMSHPRGRVALEERGVGFPGWLLRLAYRPLITPTIARFARAMTERNGD
jgi:DMSO/TMAO reductase YedYZ molybdopterin-dependent catalytic subunit